MHVIMFRSLDQSTCFFTAYTSSQPPKFYALQCFSIGQTGRQPKSAPSRGGGASTPHVIHVPWTDLTQYHRLHLDRFSCLCTAYGGPYTVQCEISKIYRQTALESYFQ